MKLPNFSGLTRLLVVPLLCCMSATELLAATLTVTSLADSGPGSLRQAIITANSSPGKDTINFTPGITGSVLLTTGQLEIRGDLDLLGPGASTLTVSGNNSHRVFLVTSGAVKISGITIKDGSAVFGDTGPTLSDDAGGILNTANLTVKDCDLLGNSGYWGGAIYNLGSQARLIVENCAFADNSANSGAGIRNSGTATIRASTFSRNSAVVGAALYNGSESAGVRAGSMSIQSCTITGNSIPGLFGYGGGINAEGVTTSIRSTIVAGNSAPSAPDWSGVFNSQDYNLIGNAGGATINGTTSHNLYNLDPKLGPLQNNGGPTLTHALLAGSPAIDAGNPADNSTPDQRGYPRVGTSDIGAFEFGGQPLTPPAISIQPQSQTVLPCSAVAFTVQASGTPPLSYQWQFNGVDMAGATNAVLTLSGGILSQVGVYRFQVVVSNAAGLSTSTVATLSVIAQEGMELLVVEDNYFRVNRFDNTTGNFLSSFTGSSRDPGFGDGITIGPDNNIYVSFGNCCVPGSVNRYSGQTGAFMDTFATGLSLPRGLVFGPDGNLYAISANDGAVIKYDGKSGNRIGSVAGGLSSPWHLAFGPDGDLYVSSGGFDDNVQRFNLATGNRSIFVARGSGGIVDPYGLAFGPDGNLYVSEWSKPHVLRYRGGTGVFMDEFVSVGSGGLEISYAVRFGPDGHLYICNDGSQKRGIFRYDGRTGAFIDVFTKGGVWEQPRDFAFTVGRCAGTVTNTSPTISTITNRGTREDTATGPIDFIVADTETSSSALTVTGSSSDTGLVTNGSLSFGGSGANRTVTITPTPNQFGTTTITVVVTGEGGLTATNRFDLTVLPVNDPPSFTKGADQVVDEDSGARTVPNWAINLRSGPTNEASQTLTFQVSNDNNALFSAPPVISPAGTLTFTPAPNASGSARVTVVLKDDGGTANGGVDTSVQQTFKITVTPVNDPPTVSLTSPVNGVSFPSGTNIVLTATASDSDGTVTKVEFFQGTTKLGEDTSAPYQWTWPNVAVGNYTLTAKATDNQDAGTLSAPVSIVVSAPANTPPTVHIVSPATRTVYGEGEPISITVEASDREGPLQKIELYAGTTQLAEAVSSPLVFAWSGAELGVSFLQARAVDAQGLAGESEVVEVQTGSACGQVAIVRNTDDPEIGQLQAYLYELGVKTKVFSRPDATLASLTGFDVVVWDDPGQAGLDESLVTLFRQLSEGGVSFYFIGEALVSSSASLSSPGRALWTGLIHLNNTTSASTGQAVDVFPETQHEVVSNGKAGTVADFAYPFSSPAVAQTGLDGEVVLGKAGGADVLVAFADPATGGKARTVSQAFGVAGPGGTAPVADRKKLFQNAVWWLLSCLRCDNLNLHLEASAPAGPVNAGEEVIYAFQVDQSGACDGQGVALTGQLPAGLQLRRVEAEGWQWSYDAASRVITVARSRIDRGAQETLRLVVEPARGGVLATRFTLRSLNETGGALADNEIEVSTDVIGSTPPVLSIERINLGLLRVRIQAETGQRAVLESTMDFSLWSPLQTRELINGVAVFDQTVAAAPGRQFYRGRTE